MRANSSSRKKLKGAQGEIEIAVPPDRQASGSAAAHPEASEPLSWRAPDNILALYARGMTTRDIQAQVQDLSGVEVSPPFISTITQAVMEEVRKSAKSPSGGGLSECLGGLSRGQSARESEDHQQSPRALR